MHEYILEKIREYLLDDLLTNNFQTIKSTFENLEKVNKVYRKIYTKKCIKDYFTENLCDISFWPYQRSSLSDLLNPVRHDIEMVEYVTRWRACGSCKQHMIDYLCQTKCVINPLMQTIFSSEDAYLLFCSDHVTDLQQRNRLKSWNRIVFQLTPEPISNNRRPLVAKVQIIITNPPSPRRWC